ncbi:MAG: DNA-protecting protein DprA [Alphaproteobacteria bacterium]|nr:DNA-protecting protein DprA [Alphaproteobacteria bacterium]MCB9791172.1 DNA-protecting protein DprA [Alphaproteobacteria bacterium]
MEIGAPARLVEALEGASPASWDGGFVALGDPGYPEALLALPKPPPALWHRGPLGLLEAPCVAVVGSRSCTPYGRSTAHRLGQAVAVAGGALISGAARGVDAAAHLGALDGGGGTLAVLGAGLDVPIQGGPARLRAQILEGGGALLSEMAPEDPPSRRSFPRRNRLIAALSACTVVVEAASRSGALHTATFARELQREVLAVPGRIDCPTAEGTLQLIEDGAGVLRQVSQVAELVRGAERALDTPARRLQRALSRPASLMQVAAQVGLDGREVARQLSLLELTGVVRRLPDQRYVLR